MRASCPSVRRTAGHRRGSRSRSSPSRPVRRSSWWRRRIVAVCRLQGILSEIVGSECASRGRVCKRRQRAAHPRVERIERADGHPRPSIHVPHTMYSLERAGSVTRNRRGIILGRRGPQGESYRSRSRNHVSILPLPFTSMTPRSSHRNLSRSRSRVALLGATPEHRSRSTPPAVES